MKCFTTPELKALLQEAYDTAWQDAFVDCEDRRDDVVDEMINRSSGGHDDRGIYVPTGEGAINRHKK